MPCGGRDEGRGGLRGQGEDCWWIVKRVSLDTTQPCKNVRAAGEQLSRSPSWYWPRARGAFSLCGGVVPGDGKVVLRVWK